jgi:hypothetical protein
VLTFRKNRPARSTGYQHSSTLRTETYNSRYILKIEWDISLTCCYIFVIHSFSFGMWRRVVFKKFMDVSEKLSSAYSWYKSKHKEHAAINVLAGHLLHIPDIKVNTARTQQAMFSLGILVCPENKRNMFLWNNFSRNARLKFGVYGHNCNYPNSYIVFGTLRDVKWIHSFYCDSTACETLVTVTDRPQNLLVIVHDGAFLGMFRSSIVSMEQGKRILLIKKQP